MIIYNFCLYVPLELSLFNILTLFLKPVDRLNCKWDAATMKESANMELLYSTYVDVWLEYDSDDGAFRRLQEISFSLQNEPQWCSRDWVQDD